MMENKMCDKMYYMNMKQLFSADTNMVDQKINQRLKERSVKSVSSKERA